MLDFIQDAASKLGIGEDTAESATAGLLSLMKEHGDAADVGEMLGKLSGASALISADHEEAVPESSDLLGGLGATLGSALGGAAGPALSGLGALTKSGLSADKLVSFVELFKDFALPKLGPDLLKRLLGSVPGLGSLLG